MSLCSDCGLTIVNGTKHLNRGFGCEVWIDSRYWQKSQNEAFDKLLKELRASNTKLFLKQSINRSVKRK